MAEFTIAERLACTEGWKYLGTINGGRIQKQHYFKDGRSVCGRYMTFGAGDCTPDNGKPQADECMACRRKITPELAPAPKPRHKKVKGLTQLGEALLVMSNAYAQK